ncbi:DUF6428 family protein [Desertivirga xinjiangensis]|uniref:DUF6428 family protein n=1 Tax=Desertivirga xinjiangensis TaxID=539206 RepID=UPI00210D2162|nr:DUF6428 family protein [Pedobacter xinjiangensis]
MNNPNALSWKSFKNKLIENPGLDLQFEYEAGKWVDQSYHITEVKQAPIVSVDCGGIKNEWTEIIIQLWEPGVKQQERAMKARKALSIIDIVEKEIFLNPEAEVKIEFGNSKFDTRQMYPTQITIDGDNLIVILSPDAVQCKAITRGGSCGTTDSGEDCCTSDVKDLKPKIQLQNLATEITCTPGSGCC